MHEYAWKRGLTKRLAKGLLPSMEGQRCHLCLQLKCASLFQPSCVQQGLIARSLGSFDDQNGCPLKPSPVPNWNAQNICNLCDRKGLCHHLLVSNSERFWPTGLQASDFSKKQKCISFCRSMISGQSRIRACISLYYGVAFLYYWCHNVYIVHGNQQLPIKVHKTIYLESVQPSVLKYNTRDRPSYQTDPIVLMITLFVTNENVTCWS